MQTARGKYRRSVKADRTVILFFVFAVCNLTSCILHAQIIAPSPYEIYSTEPKFHRAFIKQNKIKTISASVVDKPDGEIIRDKGLAQVFAFDTSGNMVHQYYNEITSLEKTEIEIPAVYKHGKVIKKAHTK